MSLRHIKSLGMLVFMCSLVAACSSPAVIPGVNDSSSSNSKLGDISSIISEIPSIEREFGVRVDIERNSHIFFKGRLISVFSLFSLPDDTRQFVPASLLYSEANSIYVEEGLELGRGWNLISVNTSSGELQFESSDELIGRTRYELEEISHAPVIGLPLDTEKFPDAILVYIGLCPSMNQNFCPCKEMYPDVG